MALKGNKGDWSEIYTLFKLLADGKVYSGDGNLNKYEDLFFPILKILRLENEIKYQYKINSIKGNIAILGGKQELVISQNQFRGMAQTLYHYIKESKSNGSKKALSFPDIESFMHDIYCDTVKAKSVNKTDIRMVIHDMRTGMQPELGFSIKSKLGGKSTLVNTSQDVTNFLYLIEGIDDQQAAKFNSMKYFKDKFGFLDELKCNVKFCGLLTQVFENNLVYIDTSLPVIISESLLRYYSSSDRKVSDIIDFLTHKNPLNFNYSTGKNAPNIMDFYARKFKQFLLAYALGMTSAKAWNGIYEANGGYLVVKEDGDVLCFHFYDRNELEDYLFYNTAFETPDTDRHKYGKIYKEGGAFYLKLNIQVRFI
ncbi:MAG: restriction endonuclease HpaII [Bacteroidetes bacterium]|nr:restriction endonuclease HpaII [Bacteroidota bacterium]